MSAVNKTNPSTALPSPLKVLVVDNDPDQASAVSESLSRIGFECEVAVSGPEGAKRIEENIYDIVITDLMMGQIDGLEILRQAKEKLADVEVILVTGHGSIPSAVTAMQQGAFHYLEKSGIDEIRAVAGNAAEKVRLRKTNVELIRRLDEKFGFEGVVGSSRQMNDVIDRLKRIAPTDATVLIQGETGTGKELVAQAIHQNSPRKKKAFVALNCAALSENILESELFGHIRGAFTDASTDRIGKFEYAHGGTMFLDEVGDMPMATQIKLLRVLENGEITRVGSNDPLQVNVRIVSATNRDLEDAIAAGTFRSDLYHRLKVITIDLPRLADRSLDIPLLIDHFVRMFTARHHKTIKGMSTAARRRLVAFDWPGNVRQLRNFIESMVVVDYDEILDEDDLPAEMGHADSASPGAISSDAARLNITARGEGLGSLVGRPLAEIERLFIAETLSVAAGNREEAATMLGIGERTLYRKIKDYKI